MDSLVKPFLMFEGRAEEAIDFYIATIPNSRLIEMNKYGPGGPAKEGTIMTARASIGGQEVMFSDSFVKHAFTFTPSLSLFVTVRNEDEFNPIVQAMADGGTFLMPPDNYGFSRKFAWLNDRFGVSWQINLP